MPCPPLGLRAKWPAAGFLPWCGRNRREQRPASGLSHRGVSLTRGREEVMVFTIGIDPHKATHTAAVLDGSETVVAELCLAADCHQRDRLLSFAERFAPRTWAIEQATGLGA